MPGGMQQQLRDIGVAPRQSVRVPVPNPRYFNADNVAQRGGRLGNAELLAAAYVGRDPASYTEATSAKFNKTYPTCNHFHLLHTYPKVDQVAIS